MMEMPQRWQPEPEMMEALEAASMEDDFVAQAFLAALADPEAPAEPRRRPTLEEALAAGLDLAGRGTVSGRCGCCWDEEEVVLLSCQHTYCEPCLQDQLKARWPGLRVSFGFLRCGTCRQELAHRTLKQQVRAHQKLQRRAVEVAESAFRMSGFHDDLSEELGRPASAEEVRQRAEEVMAVYECNDCSRLYCGGRVDCAAQQDVVREELVCPDCQWAAEADAHDHRCMVHGHRFAVFKCDSCCSLATWNCTTHHYCQRCHNAAYERKHYPCPGGELCPLGMPHPPNVEAHHGQADGKFRSFVVGCTACWGVADEDAMASGSEALHFSEANQFGYPPRRWSDFSGGSALLQEAGEEEVRGRLRVHAGALQGGTAVECAERLLLIELGISSCQQLLAQAHAEGAARLRERLASVGLPSSGPLAALAERLVSLRTQTVDEVKSAERARLREQAEDKVAAALQLPIEALRGLRESTRHRRVLALQAHRRRLELKRLRHVQEGGSRKGPVSQRGGKHKVPVVEPDCGFDVDSWRS